MSTIYSNRDTVISMCNLPTPNIKQHNKLHPSFSNTNEILYKYSHTYVNTQRDLERNINTIDIRVNKLRFVYAQIIIYIIVFILFSCFTFLGFGCTYNTYICGGTIATYVIISTSFITIIVLLLSLRYFVPHWRKILNANKN